jgi:hypothetical protein
MITAPPKITTVTPPIPNPTVSRKADVAASAAEKRRKKDEKDRVEKALEENMREQMTEFEKKKALKKKAEGEEIGSASTKKAKQEEAKPIDIEAKAKEGGAKSKAAAKPKVTKPVLDPSVADTVARLEAIASKAKEGGAKSKAAAKPKLRKMVEEEREELGKTVDALAKGAAEGAKKAKTNASVAEQKKLDKTVEVLITKLNEAGDAKALVEVAKEVAVVKRKQEEVLATSKVSKGSGDNRYKKEDPSGEKKEAEPKQKTAHPGKGSGAKLEKGKGGNDRATRQMSKSEKIEHWNGRGVQEIRNKLSQLGKVIPRSQLTGPNALKKADLLKVLHPLL